MSEQSIAAPLAKEDPETFVLRGRPRPAVRFRRGLIVGITGAVAASLIILSWLALDPPGNRKAAVPLETDEPYAKAPADALGGLPRNYGDVPRLGPPLPGDLGRPILEHERSLAQPMVSPIAATNGEPVTAAQRVLERAETARQAARTSGLMVEITSRELSMPEGASKSASQSSGAASPPDMSPAVSPGQQHKIEFAREGTETISPHQLEAAASPWMLSAGTVIPASLLTGLNSDLPGMVLAQVTENVRDSATGRTVLVPQGARLIGRYDSVVAFGQRRALVIWTRIVFPDGSSVDLDHLPASDASGYSGVSDNVDSHTWQLLKGIGMSTLLGLGTQLSFGGSSDLVRALRQSAQENAAHAGDQITSHNLDVQPTITVRPGWPVRALVNKDLVLAPWKG